MEFVYPICSSFCFSFPAFFWVVVFHIPFFWDKNGPAVNYWGSSGVNFALELYLVFSDLSSSSFSFGEGSVVLGGSQLCSASSLQWIAALHSARPRWFRRIWGPFVLSSACQVWWLYTRCKLCRRELAGGYGIALWYQQLLKVCKNSAGLFILPIWAGLFFFLLKMEAGHLSLWGRDPKCGIL